MLDKLISLYAPHECLNCQVEGKILCPSCSSTLLKPSPRCFSCQALSDGGRTCRTCRRNHKLHAVNVAAEYDGLAKDLVYKLKFGGSRAAADAMVSLMDLSNLSRDAVIVYLPTSSGRARQRGFDQAQLLARALSRRAGLVHCSALSRLGESRQVGATRRQRLEQLQDSFLVRRPASIRSQPVILVDDVMTTGASLSVAAKVLKQAGAKRVEALVFARA